MAAKKKASSKGVKTSPKGRSLRGVRDGAGLAGEIEHLRDDLRRRADAVFKEIDVREKRLEKEGLRLARNMVHKFRVGLRSSMGQLDKRVAELERRAAKLERRLS